MKRFTTYVPLILIGAVSFGAAGAFTMGHQHEHERIFSTLAEARQSPPEKLAYVVATYSGTSVKQPDYLATIDVDPTSKSYSQIVHRLNMPSGEYKGQKYAEIRDFATLAFSWPLERKGADPKAVALFEEALAARSEWRDFLGFGATIQGSIRGRRFSGTVTIEASGKVTFSDTDPSHQEAVADWVEAQLGSIVLHRQGGPSLPDRPHPVLRFAEPNGDHPFGPLLIFDGGRFASSYRIKDRQIMVVNRILGKETMTITVLDNDVNKEGKFLPRTYQVQYWDAKTGPPRRTEAIQNRWQRVGSWDLPAATTVTTADDSGLSVRSFTLSQHVLLEKKK